MLHQFTQPDGVCSTFSKQLRGRRDDRAIVFRSLFSRHAHVILLNLFAGEYHNTILVTIDCWNDTSLCNEEDLQYHYSALTINAHHFEKIKESSFNFPSTSQKTNEGLDRTVPPMADVQW